MYTTFLGKKESINVYVKGEENKNRKACGIERKNHFNTFEQKKRWSRVAHQNWKLLWNQWGHKWETWNLWSILSNLGGEN